MISAGSKSVEEKADLPRVLDDGHRYETWRPAAPATSGFFWHTGGRLYFVEWDGKFRAIGS